MESDGTQAETYMMRTITNALGAQHLELRPPRYKGTKAATSLEIGRSRKDAGELSRKDWTWGKELLTW